MFLFLTFYLQVVLQYSPLRASAAALPFSAGIIVGAGLMSQLMPKVGPKPLMVTGLALATLGMLWLTQIGADTGYATHILPSQIVMSLGMAAVFVPASSTALVGIDPHDAGVGSALLSTTQQIGGSLGTALLNTLYAGAVTSYLVGHTGLPRQVAQVESLIHGYRVAFFWAAILFAVALVVAAVLINAKKDDLPADAAAAAAAA
jgi:MFS family permease